MIIVMKEGLKKTQILEMNIFYFYRGNFRFDCLKFSTMYKNIFKATKQILSSL